MAYPYNTDTIQPAGTIQTDAMVTTALELPGYKVTRNIGLVRGITVRSRSARAKQHGANAVIAVRYDATELMAGLTEVLRYGTAVVVEPLGS